LQQLDSDGCRRVVDVLRDEPYDTVLMVAQAQSFVTLQVCVMAQWQRYVRRPSMS
jgi:hypothetical protein